VRVILFVRLKDGVALTDELKDGIKIASGLGASLVPGGTTPSQPPGGRSPIDLVGSAD